MKSSVTIAKSLATTTLNAGNAISAPIVRNRVISSPTVRNVLAIMLVMGGEIKALASRSKNQPPVLARLLTLTLSLLQFPMSMPLWIVWCRKLFNVSYRRP
ncbi:hypothetical protein LINPERPRIM_LOCUS683 [Linum perenne]